MRIQQSPPYGRSPEGRQHGFTVLEAIIAIFVVAVGITGVFALVVQSISLAASMKNQTIAWYLAQEGVEIVRNVRDTNFLEVTPPWDDGLTVCASGCEADYTSDALVVFANRFLLVDSGNFYNYDTGSEETLFKRKITITKPNPNLMEVQVEVLWDEHGNQNEVEVITELRNWK